MSDFLDWIVWSVIHNFFQSTVLILKSYMFFLKILILILKFFLLLTLVSPLNIALFFVLFFLIHFLSRVCLSRYFLCPVYDINKHLNLPVGLRICWLNSIKRRKALQKSVSKVRHQTSSSEEATVIEICGAPYCHYSRIHSDLEVVPVTVRPIG